jgi:hypothetical protein
MFKLENLARDFRCQDPYGFLQPGKVVDIIDYRILAFPTQYIADTHCRNATLRDKLYRINDFKKLYLEIKSSGIVVV